jgi:hypothetical protein
MENIDLTVLRALCQWRIANQAAMLVAVVRTWDLHLGPLVQSWRWQEECRDR